MKYTFSELILSISSLLYATYGFIKFVLYENLNGFILSIILLIAVEVMQINRTLEKMKEVKEK